jgi:hypothetical protein
MMNDPDKVKSERVMNALLQMMKLDLAVFEEANMKEKFEIKSDIYCNNI